VIAFWKRLDALPPRIAPEERVKELCTLAYREDELIAVSTMVLDMLPQLRARFGFFRCLVAPEHRRQGLAYLLGVHCGHLLSAWSKLNPEEKVLGMATIVESPALDEFSKAPVWPAPGVNGLTLIGYTTKGRQIRVSWFQHARLD
ncbi:MAG TPA: hypothetical protein VED46_09345, partial [Alphaproteobacteria bacterium]|nr:hypothetical protein [Alphaproteobacteria bacterium]